MSAPTDTAADAARRLDALAELTLEVAVHVAGALKASRGPDDVLRLSRAYATVSRSLRMTCALSLRLDREGAAPPVRAEQPAAVEALVADAVEAPEQPERPARPDSIDREDLYDRLPPGQLPDQIAAVARSLVSALQVLPDRGAAARARCEAVTGVVLPLPRRATPQPAKLRAVPSGTRRPDGQVLVLSRPPRLHDG